LRVERWAVGLLSIVLLGLGATGAANPAAAERITAGSEAAKQGHGKLGTAHMPDGKLGTAHLPILSVGSGPVPVSVPVPVSGPVSGSVTGPGSGPESGAVAGTISPEEALDRRLAGLGMKLGSPIMIRIFKSEAELEVWMKAGERFELLASYAICNWAGTLGPKLSEGDKQSPEGLYSVGRRQLHHGARWRRSLDIGYPNAFDRVHVRTGSSILLHGGCTTTGCFAMTDQVMEEIFRLSRAALWNGQKRIAVHIFPFRMTPENMATHADSPWQGFWANLKEAYDLFERTRLPPTVKVCDRRYTVSEAGDSSGCPGAAVTAAIRPREAATKRRSVGVAVVKHRRPRSARRAYAEARKARLAIKASQRARLRHVETVGYRKLRR
jgi:murein L,D-transpeptidase YafK